jgi:hypothetical protein
MTTQNLCWALAEVINNDRYNSKLSSFDISIKCVDMLRDNNLINIVPLSLEERFYLLEARLGKEIKSVNDRLTSLCSDKI